MEDHEIGRKIIGEWMALPKDSHRNPLFAPIKIAPPVSVANALRVPVNWELLALPVDIEVTT
jgi:hypothetical protein